MKKAHASKNMPTMNPAALKKPLPPPSEAGDDDPLLKLLVFGFVTMDGTTPEVLVGIVGLSVGNKVSVGLSVGNKVRVFVLAGNSVGVSVGKSVGVSVGEKVGTPVLEGLDVVVSVGYSVGNSVGESVGESVLVGLCEEDGNKELCEEDGNEDVKFHSRKLSESS
mmetsp:Transcript_6966/g.15067  ORF Transcript_6966/g.15067 Transcript_6966/m.15067 type:complete len:165 (+) Transcript_6966:912-1406(+)